MFLASGPIQRLAFPSGWVIHGGLVLAIPGMSDRHSLSGGLRRR